MAQGKNMSHFEANLIHLQIDAELYGIHKLDKHYGYIAVLRTPNRTIPAYVSESMAQELKPKIGNTLATFLCGLEGTERYLISEYMETK